MGGLRLEDLGPKNRVWRGGARIEKPSYFETEGGGCVGVGPSLSRL